MESSPSIVTQTAAMVVSLLKPLVESEQCQIKRREDGVLFLLKKGSAQIGIFVGAHPRIEDESVVEIIGHLAEAPIEQIDAEFLRRALTVNSTLHGYAIAYDKDMGAVVLRGSLIGSTMDTLEFEYLLSALSTAADELDDVMQSALTGQVQSDDTEVILGELKEMAEQLIDVLDKKEEAILNGFVETLSDADRAEFATMIKDEEIREAIRVIVFGLPAAKLATVILHGNLTDEARCGMASAILEKLPGVPMLLAMLAFAVTSTALMVASAIGMDKEIVHARFKAVFQQ